MTLNYTQIFDETLKSKFKELVQSGHASGGLRLRPSKNNWLVAMIVGWTG